MRPAQRYDHTTPTHCQTERIGGLKIARTINETRSLFVKTAKIWAQSMTKTFSKIAAGGFVLAMPAGAAQATVMTYSFVAERKFVSADLTPGNLTTVGWLLSHPRGRVCGCKWC